MFLSGSTQAYQKNQLDEKSIAVLEQLIEANNGKPVALSCGMSQQNVTEKQAGTTYLIIYLLHSRNLQ